MSNQFALRGPRASARIGLALILTLTWSATVSAQVPADADPAPADAGQAEPPAAADDAAAQGAVNPETAPSGALDERYTDPRAAAAIANNFPQLYREALPLRGNAQNRFEAMLAGQGSADPAIIQNYVKYQLAQLTRPQNIAPMLDPAAPAKGVEAYEEFGANLRTPLEKSQNAGFRSAYTKALADLAPDVLKNHLYARLAYMLALSRSRDAAAIPVFLSVLKDKDQPLTLKILASVGLTELAQNGRIDVSPSQAKPAARAVADFLEAEPDTFWPAQFRALQALGSLRQSASDPLKPDADLAATALSFLADPEANPAVRAWAAWALGMMRPSDRTAQFNFLLVAHHMGQAAVDIGNIIVETQQDNPEEAVRLTDLLLQLYLSFVGVPDIRDAGLLKTDHPNLTAQRGKIQAIADRVRNLAAAAVELVRSPRQQWPQLRSALQSRVQELGDYLAKTPPPDVALFPNGPEFPVARAAGGGQQARAETEVAIPR